MFSAITGRICEEIARQNYRSVVRVGKSLKLDEVVHSDGRAGVDAHIGWAAKRQQSIFDWYFFNSVFGIADSTHSLCDAFTATVEHSDDPGTRFRAESANDLFEREPPYLICTVQNREAVVVLDSVARVVDEDESCFPFLVPVISDLLRNIFKQLFEVIEVAVFIHMDVPHPGAQAKESLFYI